MDMGLVHCVVCLFIPQLFVILIVQSSQVVPAHGGLHYVKTLHVAFYCDEHFSSFRKLLKYVI